MNTKKDVLSAYYPRGFYGIDKQGRPIYIERTGIIDVKKLLEGMTEEEFWQNFVWGYEDVGKRIFMTSSLLAQKQIFTTMSIQDLKGFSIMKLN